MSIDLLLNHNKLFRSKCFERRFVFFSCLHFNLILFTSTEFCRILTQFDVIWGGLKLIFRLHGENMPNYNRVEIFNSFQHVTTKRVLTIGRGQFNPGWKLTCNVLLRDLFIHFHWFSKNIFQEIWISLTEWYRVMSNYFI